MRNVFALEKQTKKYDGDKFIIRRADREIAEKQKRQEEEEKAFQRAAGFPVWLNIIGLVLFCFGLMFLGGFVEALDSDNIKEIFDRAWWILVIGGVAAAGGGIILILASVRNKRARASSAFAYIQERRDKLDKESYESLHVSETAKSTDVIAMLYKQKKNGKLSYKENNNFTTTQINLSALVYAENDALCFAFTDCIFAIPFSRIERIQCINKRIFVMSWNKGEFKKNQFTGTFVYNDCKITVNNNGAYGFKPYYRIILRDENYEEFYILIPCYDIQPILSLTGKNVE